MKRLILGLLVLISFAPMWTKPSSAQIATDLVVEVEPTASTLVLGDSMVMRVTVSNLGAETSPELVVHLDITGLDSETSVDPEDWTPNLNQIIGSIGSGQSASVDWNLQPIAPGKFAAYATVLSAADDTVAASNVLTVEVDDQRSLNPNGILPLAIASPSLIGAVLLFQLRRNRRTF